MTNGTISKLMAAAIVCATGASFAHAEGINGKITFYTHFGQFVDSGDWVRWATAFEEKYPGTEVEILHVANFRKEMPTRIASGDYGDVLNVMDNLPPAEYGEFYLPLNDMSLAETHSFVDRYDVDGNIYGYVYGANAEAVVYNKAAFERAGIESIPTTKTELFAACEALKAEGIVPFQINMGAGWPMQQWDKAALLFADDGSYFDAVATDPAPFADGKPYGEAMQYVRELFEAGCTERDYTANNWDESKMMLGAGEAAMWFLANWSIPQTIIAGESLGLENVSDDLGMFPLPVDDSGDPAVLLWPDWALGVSSQSQNPDTAKAWIEFLLTETDVANAAGFIPGDPRIAPVMPQLEELFAREPRTIEAGTPSSEFKQAMADARLDFMTGTYIRDLVLAEDFDAAIEKVNDRWSRAIAK
ncbi:ABC-type glycerol-3-phosphate transport system substrate-binding protein [Primorskyibacter sedentarius]|uniref:ABC-type glycerol-3-phosphate transport system substrate-binding protein n=1 Tax=Primorskyibacter sedentarius TaxID=745311 RepID=A0A4R3J5P8_9RHOB|nr:ABC transporter substrate-binding protein [Primorskyibacter sedentarius]TCS59730.1 ABC-type glycerol-3-phosphate transport system substrate-binding protein [Primorskyibacter sedentarius]